MLDQKVFQATPATAVTRATQAEPTLAREVRQDVSLTGLEIQGIAVSQVQVQDQDQDPDRRHAAEAEIEAIASLDHHQDHHLEEQQKHGHPLTLYLHHDAAGLHLQTAEAAVQHDLLPEAQCLDRVHLPEKPQLDVGRTRRLFLARRLPGLRARKPIPTARLDVVLLQGQFHVPLHDTKTRRDAAAPSLDLARRLRAVAGPEATQAVVRDLHLVQKAAKQGEIVHRAQRTETVYREAGRDRLRP